MITSKYAVGAIKTDSRYHIVTVFWAFVGPLIPRHSLLVTSEKISRHGTGTKYEARGIQLPLQWDSVLLGYLRVWPLIAAFVLPFVLYWGESVQFRSGMWISVALVALWLCMLLLPGFLLRRHRTRREMLVSATGQPLEPNVGGTLIFSRVLMRWNSKRMSWAFRSTTQKHSSAGSKTPTLESLRSVMRTRHTRRSERQSGELWPHNC